MFDLPQQALPRGHPAEDEDPVSFSRDERTVGRGSGRGVGPTYALESLGGPREDAIYKLWLRSVGLMPTTSDGSTPR